MRYRRASSTWPRYVIMLPSAFHPWVGVGCGALGSNHAVANVTMWHITMIMILCWMIQLVKNWQNLRRRKKNASNIRLTISLSQYILKYHQIQNVQVIMILQLNINMSTMATYLFVKRKNVNVVNHWMMLHLLHTNQNCMNLIVANKFQLCTKTVHIVWRHIITKEHQNTYLIIMEI